MTSHFNDRTCLSSPGLTLCIYYDILCFTPCSPPLLRHNTLLTSAARCLNTNYFRRHSGVYHYLRGMAYFYRIGAGLRFSQTHFIQVLIDVAYKRIRRIETLTPTGLVPCPLIINAGYARLNRFTKYQPNFV